MHFFHEIDKYKIFKRKSPFYILWCPASNIYLKQVEYCHISRANPLMFVVLRDDSIQRGWRNGAETHVMFTKYLCEETHKWELHQILYRGTNKIFKYLC